MSAFRERPRAPVSAGLGSPAAIATDRPSGSSPLARGVPADGGPRRIRVGIIGATGYVGGGADPAAGPPPERRRSSGWPAATATTSRSAATTPHLAATEPDRRDASCPDVDAAFLALPHGAAAKLVPDLLADRGRGHRPRSRLPAARRRPTIRAGTASSTRTLSCSTSPSTGCPELHRAELEALVDAPIAHRRRAGLLSRPRPCWPSRRWPGPGSSATSWSMPRAACPAPAARPSPT